MKELKDMSTYDRMVVGIQCEPFLLTFKKPKVFHNVFKTIKGSLEDKYDKEVWLVISALIKAMKYSSKGIRFTLTSNNYSIANKLHGLKINLDRTKYVINNLEERGFITFYKGYYKSAKDSMMSCMFYTDKFSNMICKKKANQYGMKRNKLGFLEIKDKDNKVFLDYTTFRGYSTIITDMEKYNSLLGKTIIEFPDEETGEMIQCSASYKRKFSGDLNGEGRFYSVGYLQTIKSYLRKYITIDKEGTTEIDYCNLHPRMLYTLEDIELPYDWDAYCIEGLDHVISDKKELRKFIKTSYLAVLFSDTKSTAINSVFHKASSNDNVHVGTLSQAAYVVDKIIEKNQMISKYFFKTRLWAKLQNLDSQLAEYVIMKFTSIDKVCLGWHDSFVVKKEDQVLLLEFMREAWISIFHTEINLKVEIEF